MVMTYISVFPIVWAVYDGSIILLHHWGVNTRVIMLFLELMLSKTPHTATGFVAADDVIVVGDDSSSLQAGSPRRVRLCGHPQEQAQVHLKPSRMIRTPHTAIAFCYNQSPSPNLKASASSSG
ncbi:hypothetical protein BJY01DRAFT_140369 [Aspergillus pseudoustus]|uniref:Uncharacterized protein n=1 Tax=Aspergillus pseudoustus TaxID=1810923 RepID=A0ABR4KC52_9EURO